MREVRLLSVFVLAFLCASPAADAQSVIVTDEGLDTDFQHLFLGHHGRGRAQVAADFDLDGRIDFFVGNPGDESFILRNTAGPVGEPLFQLVQTLTFGELSWGGAAADYDNDGDYDLFISVGGNEDIGFDRLFKNMWVESGGTSLSFLDVTATAGISGPIPPAVGFEIPVASAGAVWVDYDRDGDVDLFVNGNIVPSSYPPLRGRNILWENNGNGTFTDVTDTVGLGTSLAHTRHSTFFDIDNDGDPDLYEANFGERNIVWRNLLVESGNATFQDDTFFFSNPPADDPGFPRQTYASAASDFNNDGWLDLIVFMRDADDPNSPYGDGHALFLNQTGTGLTNVAASAAINNPYQPVRGVMGCQVGDINADGVPDVFIGNGFMLGDMSPFGGQFNQLYLSDSAVGASPHFLNNSSLIDFPAPEDPSFPPGYQPYPYRTHGTSFIDVDGDTDGMLEIAVINGGPQNLPPQVREPNRLFKFDWNPVPAYLKLRCEGDGVTVSRDGIGTRFALTVSSQGGPTRTIYNALYGGSAFSSQNGFEVFFGLGDADAIHSLTITWPDGSIRTITDGLQVSSSRGFLRTQVTGDVPPTLTATSLGSQMRLDWSASCATGDGDYGIYEGSLGANFTNHQIETCSTSGGTTLTITPDPGDRYFLVAPQAVGVEGSYGRRSDGTERPQAASACQPQSIDPKICQ